MARLSDSPRFRPGFVFKNGKAYEFEAARLTVIRPWPAPSAWCLEGDATTFRHVFPELELYRIRGWARPGFVERKVSSILRERPEWADDEERFRLGFSARHDAARAFLDAIPPSVRRAVCRFPRHQWQMLTFLGRVPGGLDLVESNPALAWALALNPTFHRPRVQRPLTAARRWVNRPRRLVAGWLGFPPTRSAVRLLAKIEPRALAATPMFALRKLLRDDVPELVVLRHLPRVDAPVLEAVGRRRLRALMTGPLFTELADATRPRAAETLGLLYDLSRMLRLLGDGDRRVESVAHLTRVHDELVVRVNELPARGHYRFPKPPIPGSDDIEPIATSAELAREGREMHHCVGSYAEWIASGGCFVYRVLSPERATFSLERTRGGGWRITQLRAAANHPVRAETAAHVRRWFERDPSPVDPTPMFPEFQRTG